MLRLMTTDDHEQAYALWHGLGGVGLRSLDDSEEGIVKFLYRNPTTCFVAVEDDKIIGTILCGHDGRRGYIYHLAVAEEYRRKGIASQLLLNACEALKKEGIHKAGMLVFKQNEAGNAFWDRYGWDIRTDVYYRNLSLNEENR